MNRYGLFLEQTSAFIDADGEEHDDSFDKLVAVAAEPQALIDLCVARHPQSVALWFDNEHVLNGHIVDFATGCMVMKWVYDMVPGAGRWQTLDNPVPMIRTA